MNFFRTSLLFTAVCSALFITACSEDKKPEQPARELTEEEQRIETTLASATFERMDGSSVSLEDYEGKVVLVDFWESWCGPCLQVFPGMNDLVNEYPNDFAVLAVNLTSADTKEDVAAFMEEYDYGFDYVLDANAVGDKVITLGIPFKVFMDPQGNLIKAELGLTGNDYEDAKKIIEQHKKS